SQAAPDLAREDAETRPPSASCCCATWVPRRCARPYAARLAGEALATLIATEAWIFSQMRGTAKSTVGCTSARSVVTVSIDSAKWTTVRLRTPDQVVTARSTTWESGR